MLFRVSLMVGLASATLVALTMVVFGALFPLLTAVVSMAVVAQYSLDEIGHLELPGPFDQVVLFGGMTFLLVGATWSTFMGQFGWFFVVLTLFMSLGAVLVPWRGGLSLYVFAGVLGSIFVLQLDMMIMFLFGIPLFISVFLLSMVWHFQSALDQSMDVNELKSVIATSLIYAVIIGIPMFSMGIIAPALQPDWTQGSIGDGPTEPVQMEGLDALGVRLLVAVVVLGGLLVGVYWIIRRLREEQDELVEKVDMPDTEGMDVQKTTADDAINLRPVVRGGRKADILKQMHDLLDRVEETDFEREQQETVQAYLHRHFTPEPLDARGAQLVASIYTGARYGYREPDADQFEQFGQLIDQLEEYLRNQ